MKTAMMRDAYSAYDSTTARPVAVRKAKKRGEAYWQFQAPGWRSMHFSTEAGAVAKAESHPGFVGWQ